jgi:hypothetical protein
MDYIADYAPIPSFKTKNVVKRRIAITTGVIAALYASEKYNSFVTRSLRSVKRWVYILEAWISDIVSC